MTVAAFCPIHLSDDPCGLCRKMKAVDILFVVGGVALVSVIGIFVGAALVKVLQ